MIWMNSFSRVFMLKIWLYKFNKYFDIVLMGEEVYQYSETRYKIRLIQLILYILNETSSG